MALNIEDVANAIHDFCATFGILECLVGDGTTNFRNEIQWVIPKNRCVPHQFGLDCCMPLSGRIELLEKELLNVPAHFSELQAAFKRNSDLRKQ